MLGEGHRRAERGTDVVVGFVETHGRAHTAELVEGLEVVPRTHPVLPRRHLHGDGPRRRPRPTPRRSPWSTSWPTPTCPGRATPSAGRTSRSCWPPGIDVITTVNIQHLESLNDVVETITGVPQRETVPDAVVRAADQIELVDMTAEALRRRLAHGNVYAPEKVDAALANYFRAGNLNALRELALLWIADRVDDALQELPREARHHRDLGGPGARGGRADRRSRGRDADPSRGPDRGPVQRRRPARRARRPVGRPRRGEPGRAGRATPPGRVARRHLPPGARRRRPRGPAHLRPGRERHPAGPRRQPATAPGRACSAPGTATALVRDSGDIDVHIVTHAQTGRGLALPHGRGSLTTRRKVQGYALALVLPAAPHGRPDPVPRRAQPGQRHAALPAADRRGGHGGRPGPRADRRRGRLDAAQLLLHPAPAHADHQRDQQQPRPRSSSCSWPPSSARRSTLRPGVPARPLGRPRSPGPWPTSPAACWSARTGWPRCCSASGRPSR